ncbi:MAG: sulfocyanin-like copper-binding protein [Hyphomicrobiales bacterium]
MDAEQLLTLGSVNEIAPNASAPSLTLNLDPGKYLLYCNIAGHYAYGMWTVIDVQ